MLNCTDISNYSGPLSATLAQGLKNAGIRLVIVQAVSPPAGYPAGVTRQQIQACLDAGLVVDAYVYLWFDQGASSIQARLDLLTGLPIRRCWLDLEDTAARGYDTVVCEQKVQAALNLCDNLAVTGNARTGIYTGHWFWTATAYMGNTEAFSDRDLWDSNYDGVPDPTVNFRPYGGWQRCAIKQHMGTSTLAGVPNVDLNALSDEELARLNPEEPDMDCGPYKDSIERAVNRLQIELNKKTASGRPAALSKTIVRQISSELFEALQG